MSFPIPAAPSTYARAYILRQSGASSGYYWVINDEDIWDPANVLARMYTDNGDLFLEANESIVIRANEAAASITTGMLIEIDGGVLTNALYIDDQASSAKTISINAGGEVFRINGIGAAGDVGDTFTQDLQPLTPSTYDLGKDANRWNDVWLNNDLHIGSNIVLKEEAGPSLDINIQTSIDTAVYAIGSSPSVGLEAGNGLVVGGVKVVGSQETDPGASPTTEQLRQILLAHGLIG